MNTPKPFTKNQLGALYMALVIGRHELLLELPPHALHNLLMLQDLIRQHIIAAGGNAEELDNLERI